MKATLLILIGFVFYLQSSAQDKFYINPNVGIVWNSYRNSYENITGNEDVANVFWDNDWIFGLLAGYKLDNNLILESGFIYHNAVDRYHLNYSELSIVGGSSVSLGEGFYCIPLNIKYSFKTKIEKLKIIPYLGLTFSTHNINSSPYMTDYNIIYADESTFDNPIPLDTTAIIQAYRPSKNNVLINYGIGFEYQILDKLIFTLSGNFTSGFSDMNRLEVDVILADQIESGEIKYRGNKFFISGGLKIPFGFNNE
jgi:hypothetical protein